MKICFLTYNIFDLGGIQRVVSVIANELVERYEVDILCTNTEYQINRELYKLKNNINVDMNSSIVEKKILKKIVYKILKIINNKTGILNNKRFNKILTEIYFPKTVQDNLIKYINSKKYDIVIGVAGELSLLLGSISSKINAKTIGWQHNSYDAYLNNKGRYFWNQDELFKKYIPNLDEYIVLTEYDKVKFKENMNIDCKVIYNPRSFTSKEKSSLKNKQFLSAGRFNYQKGFDLLIESFYEFSKYNKDWNLVIVGEGEEKEKIKEYISKFKLNDRVKIDGFTNDIKKYFLESSVLLFPSRWEGMPMLILESMEMGVPVISYDIISSKEIITHGNEGILVDSFDTKKFSNSMIALVNDYDEILKMSSLAISRSNEFDINVIIKQWEKIL